MFGGAFQRPVVSKSTVDFLDALTVNQASETVSLVLPTRDAFWFIRAVSIVAVQNLTYELMFFNSANNLNGNLDTDQFNSTVLVPAATAGPPASAGYPVDQIEASPGDTFVHLFVGGLNLPYFDGDQLAAMSQQAGGTYPNNAHLHVRLVNRSAAAKNADAGGALKVTVFVAAQGIQA